MPDPLYREDWVRISEALSHFTHNPEFHLTYEKVRAISEGNVVGST